ncbi:tubulin-like doman-containing protein [Salinigranum halophilum]|uniref:tubulin-like doman-containing protein n=1 Tax=Salinigranum halophilum TaxID=2565931 RepID=UPI0010A915D8|nr:tubulin-like doman-containing protein [Salinigranum halophilum]
MNLPDKIYAVGGAGKNIAYTLLESDWVLKEILEPKMEQQTLEVVIIDTATEERVEDKERVQSIRRRISEKREELRDSEKGRVGSVEVDLYIITERIQLARKLDLLDDGVVSRISNAMGMDPEDWWLRDEHINENLNFATGVVRQRGLGKALYYKSYAGDDTIAQAVDLPDRGEVAVFAGIGGGTGSGVFIDLAKTLKREQPMAEVTLFGILPNADEGIDESTNAYAALSELEHLNLLNEELFQNRILIPIRPTGFEGKISDQVGMSERLEELDQGLLYLIAAYYNTLGMEDMFDHSPKYAPFTIGIPQVLRYQVEAISKSREKLSSILDTKEKELDAKQQVYDDVERFLDQTFEIDDVPSQALRDDARADLRSRLASIENLTEFELFHELEYRSIGIYREIIDDARSEADEIEAQVDIAARSVRTAGGVEISGDQQFVDSIDERLAELLKRSILLLNQQKRLLQRRRLVEVSRIRRTIEYLLSLNDESVNTGVWDGNLEEDLQEAEKHLETLNEKLQEVEREIDEHRDSRAEEIRDRLGGWEQDIAVDYEDYRAASEVDVERRADELVTALRDFASGVKSVESQESLDNISAQPVNEALSNLTHDLDRVGVNITQIKRDVQEAVDDLQSLRTDSLTYTADGGVMDRFTSAAPWETSSEKDRKAAKKSYNLTERDLSETGIFEVGTISNFSVDVTFDPDTIVRRVEDRRHELRTIIVDELDARLDNPNPDALDRIEASLERNHDLSRLKEIAEEAIRAEISGTEEIETRKRELEAEHADVAQRVEAYENVLELFRERIAKQREYSSKRSEFIEQVQSYDDDSPLSSVAGKDDYTYVNEVKPNDILQLTKETDIGSSSLFDSSREVEDLREVFDGFVEKARSQDYTGLRERKLVSETRYDHIRVGVAVMSRAIDQLDSDVIDFRRPFTNAFELGHGDQRQSRYVTWPEQDFGGPWEVGFAAFIDGVFLDNLREVVQSSGYSDSYQEKRRSDDDIVLHHNHGLESGQLVRRNNVFNVRRRNDLDFFLRDEAEVVEDLLTKHIDTVSTRRTSDRGSGDEADTEMTFESSGADE